MKIFNTTAFVICAAFMVSACTPKQKSFEMGSYGYDVKFLSDNSIEYLELSSEDGQARVMLVPGWQGRVMTSTASGDDGDSYGWINYELISSVQVNHQFNPYGGEERFWFGPEGGPFSLYFAQDAEQVYENWRVPAVIDTEGYDVSAVSDASVTFTKNTVLTNASGTRFDIDIDRTVSLMSDNDIEKDLGFVVSQQMKVVA